MERLTQRESILLGYSPQNIIISTPTSSEPKPPLGNSDVDFNDVFGGPPRRYTIQERPHSFTQTTDSDSVLLPRRPWSGLSEKPVFGEESANRRRYAGDDFFDDIFRGDESCNSPRRSGLDPYRSTPGSRILSPARPLPPKAEPFGNSQLAPFSLPAKLTKAMDFPAFGSGNRSPYKHNGASNGINVPHSPLSRFSSQAIQGEDELKNDVQQSFRQHSLSHEFSRDSKEFSCLTKSDETEIRGNIKKDAKAREPPSNSNQFHFSIYKWASKGVPLLMPLRGGNSLRSREKCKTERCSSSNGRIENDINVSQLKTSEMCNVDSLLLNQRTSLNAESSKMESEKQENGSFLDSSTQNKVGYCEIANEALFAIPESKPLDNYQNSVEDISDDLMGRDKREVIEPCSLPEIGFQEKVEKEIPMFTQEAQKSQLRPSRSLSKDKNEIQGTDDIIKKDDEKEIVTIAKVLLSNVDLTENVGKHDGKQKISKGVKTDKASSQGPRVNSGNNLGRNRDRGKVKEFVKIFNEEASSKPKTNVDTQTQSSRWKNKSSYGAYNETTVSTKGTDAKLNIPNVKDVRTFPDASVKVEKDVEQLKKQHSHTKSTIDQRSDNSSGQKGVPVSISESLPFDANDTNLDVPFDFLIKELSIDEGKLIHGGEDNDEIQVIDVKIRKWSKGKEGNIRSLLSTLQYVLWPQSGWKPVPLVDIIEGSAVKRAYQKALLCLHPDKLQQKGAASHQKYTAEKVFDILQEAWDHFNISLGSL